MRTESKPNRRKPSNHKGRGQEKKGTESNYKSSQNAINKMAISIHSSIITLNVNGLKALIKGHIVAE